MYKKILVPVDGSEGSWKALADAIEVGTAMKSEIVICNVVQPYNNASLLAVPMDQSAIIMGNEELEKIGDKVLTMAKERVAEYPYGIKLLLSVGYPAEKIIANAKEEQADVIFIGSRGLSGIAEFFLGSVSSKVSQYAPCPVVIVK